VDRKRLDELGDLGEELVLAFPTSLRLALAGIALSASSRRTVG
jgi:hypothetical protein